MTILTEKFLSKLPRTFTVFDGGLYIGNFYPGPPVNSVSSDLLGNKNTGSAINYKSYADGKGDKGFGWAIIVASKDYLPSKQKSYFIKTDPLSDYETSLYDGYYNKAENTRFYKNFKTEANYGGYNDWYIPSVDELAFITKIMPIGYYIPRKFDSFTYDVYRSSSYRVWNSKQNSNFYYGQSFDKTKYGRVSLVERTIQTPKIRLIRKINLVNI